ncbi:MAG: hypothetical protein IT522_03405 [Burkholderiales bacterium]|nr:hypothetical protein [Burkholderiales bacterium]
MSAHAALVLLFDIGRDVASEHDHWHTHEHMPERLGIPGFLRGTRWTARDTDDADVHYCVVYEVEALGVLDSPAYRERLDHPTTWTAAMMRHYRVMRRALCTAHAGVGCGAGSTLLAITFAPAAGAQHEVDRWLIDDVLAGLAQRPGLADARLYRNALAAAMTTEQAIRGRDATLHSALLVTGYDEAAVAALAADELAPERFAAHGAAASETAARVYRQAYALAAGEIRTTLDASSPVRGGSHVDAGSR